MTSLKEHAENFFARYAAAAAKGSELMESPNNEAKLNTFADTMVSFRSPGVVSFGLPGGPQQTKSPEAGKPFFILFMKQLIKFNIGFANEMKSKDVQVLYDHGGYGACLVKVMWTWVPHEKSGLERWDMVAYYGYRRLEGGEEGVEYAYHDEEMKGLLERVGPQFFEGMIPSS